MENSNFAKLSAELRNIIWELALRQDKPLRLTGEFSLMKPAQIKAARDQAPRPSQAVALIKTCRQIRSECVLMFFHVNSFEFSTLCTKLLSGSLTSFREQIGSASFSAIPRVVISYETQMPGPRGFDLHFLEDSNGAVACLRSFGIRDIGVRVTYKFRIACYGYSASRTSCVLSFNQWDSSWSAAAEVMRRAIRADGSLRIERQYLRGFLQELPAHKRALGELWEVEEA